MRELPVEPDQLEKKPHINQTNHSAKNVEKGVKSDITTLSSKHRLKTKRKTEQQQLVTNRCELANNVVQSGEMADLELILQELRGFRQENKGHLETIREKTIKANTRLDEAEGRIEKAEERIQNTDVITAMLKLKGVREGINHDGLICGKFTPRRSRANARHARPAD